MLLLTGPPGSGKTFALLDELRDAVRRGDTGVVLLVPTATMARHLRNQMARDGFVFRPSLIQTLSRFIENWSTDLPEIAGPAFNLLVERTAIRLALPEFAAVVHTAGFSASLARALEECSAAGLDARLLRRHLPATPLRVGFLAIYQEIERELHARGLALRAARLMHASMRIVAAGKLEPQTVWMDGFVSLSDPELAVVQALAKHAKLTLTLPSADMAAPTRQRLLTMGFTERVCAHTPTPAARELVVAATQEREADEIARRILELIVQGREFRDMGIITRSDETYVPLLRAAFDRFGIPVRFYFDPVLADHAVVRHLAGLVDAMLEGWDHSATLAALRLTPTDSASSAMDRLDFAIRGTLPGQGLEAFKPQAAEDPRLTRILDTLAALEGLRDATFTPPEWIARLADLRSLVRFRRPADPADREIAFVSRSQARALDAFEEALKIAASAFAPDERVSLRGFWGAAKAVLRLTRLRVPDDRRNVVHVLSAHEARQWELPAIFVCGLVEGQFPRYHPQDSFLPDSARRHLQQAGFRLRTTADLENEEQFLFESAASRATSLLVLSYPQANDRGDLNLRSLFLDPDEAALSCPAVRPRPLRPPATSGPSIIADAGLLQVLADKHTTFKPTALESYLQCPFQFFGWHTLALKPPPQRPEKRLDFRVRGNIIHEVLAQWFLDRPPLDPLFDRVFEECVQRHSIPASYHTAFWREAMRRDLRNFVQDTQWPAGFTSRTEQQFEFALDTGVRIKGRADRIDSTEDGVAFVIDYKYSKVKSRTRLAEPNLLQGALYLLAVERTLNLTPGGMLYCTLGGDTVTYGGWSDRPLGNIRIEPFTRDWMEAAASRSAAAAGEIIAGRTVPVPSDPGKCRLCDFRDVCRYDATAVVAESA